MSKLGPAQARLKSQASLRRISRKVDLTFGSSELEPAPPWPDKANLWLTVRKPSGQVQSLMGMGGSEGGVGSKE